MNHSTLPSPTVAQEAAAEAPARPSLLRQFRRYAPVDFARYLKFIVAGQHVGWVRRDMARHLAPFDKIFAVDGNRVAMQESLGDFASRSAAMADVLSAWREAGLVSGWRNELFPVNRGFGLPPLLCMERAGTPLFGILSYGVNINGLVGRGAELRLWIGRRAPHKQVDPNMLDLLVGGGQPMGISVWENLVKECWEEAGIEPAMARQAKSVGLTTLTIEAPEGLRVGLQFNYDLHLPPDFTPSNTDGEVAAFQLMPVQALIENLRRADDFTYDIALVKIDLLIRHGYIGPDDPDYLDLIAGLRRPIAFDPS